MIKNLIRKAVSKFIFWLYRDYQGIIVPGVYKNINQFFIDRDVDLYLMGNLKIRSNQHIMINSSTEQEKTTNDQRQGYHYGLWLNSELDNNGLPIRYVLENNQLVKFDARKHDWVTRIDKNMHDSGGCII